MGFRSCEGFRWWWYLPKPVVGCQGHRLQDEVLGKVVRELMNLQDDEGYVEGMENRYTINTCILIMVSGGSPERQRWPHASWQKASVQGGNCLGMQVFDGWWWRCDLE